MPKLKAYIEEKQGDKYFFAHTSLTMLRADDRYALILGVQAQDPVQPVVPPRGFPDNASPEVAEAASEDEPIVSTWLTGEEVAEVHYIYFQKHEEPNVTLLDLLRNWGVSANWRMVAWLCK